MTGETPRGARPEAGSDGVVAHKAAMEKQHFSEVMLASRTLSKVEAIAAEVEQLHGRKMRTAQVDADNVPQLTKLLQHEKPAVVINVALPYQDLHIMDACLNAGVDYLDQTALRYRIFRDVWAVRTLLVQESVLPPLEHPERYGFAGEVAATPTR